MKIKTYLFPILVIALFSGSCNLFQSNSGQYELVVLDTLNIPFSGDIHAGTYAHNTGLIYNYQSGEYLKFDSLGNVLANKIIPTVGDSGLYYVNGLKIIENGNILAKSIKGEIGLLDEELNLVKKQTCHFPMDRWTSKEIKMQLMFIKMNYCCFTREETIKAPMN